MSVNNDGFISTLSDTTIQEEFRAVLEQTCQELRIQCEKSLHSLYLYGSVAEGIALPYCSDLDLSIIVTEMLTDLERCRMNDIRIDLEKRYPIVSKIDFDIGTIAEVINQKGELSWGYWLKHHCRCIFGEDLSLRFDCFRPSKAIALAVNGDYDAVLTDYHKRITEAKTVEIAQRLQREAARKLIRSTNILRKERDTDWPKTLNDHAFRFINQYPSLQSEIDYFLAESQTATSHSQEFIIRLNAFVLWMKQEENKTRSINYNA